MSEQDDFDRPVLNASPAQFLNFAAHVAGCRRCRATVVAGWSASMDVTDTLDGLCGDGATLIAARITDSTDPAAGPS